MSGILVVAAAAFLAVAVALWALRRPAARPAGSAEPAGSAGPAGIDPSWAGATAPLWGRRIGIVVGLVVALLACTAGSLGSGAVLAAPLFGFTVLLGVLAGELAVARPAGRIRTADLTVRRAWQYLPRQRGNAVAAAGVVLLGLLVLTAATGSADDLGRAGRALSTHCPAQQMTATASPWPGTFYAVPLGLLILAGFAAAAITLHRVIRRPRFGDPAHCRDDEQARRRSGEVVLAALGIMVATSLVGVGVVCAVTISDISCRPAHASASLAVLTVIVLSALGVLISSFRSLTAPRTDARLSVLTP